jgi:hypothetical protein
MQPRSIMELCVAVAALIVALAVAYYTVANAKIDRNAALVSIGIGILRADPTKEPEITRAAREWALDLIDENAGGVKFSQHAREELLKNSLKYLGSGSSYTYEPTWDPADRTYPPTYDPPSPPARPSRP